MFNKTFVREGRGRCREYHFGELVGVSALYLSLASYATAAAGAYVSYDAAQQQNEAIKKGAAAQAKAEAIKQHQITQQSVEAQKLRVKEANQIAARIRVARGEAGVGLGGSTEAMLRQVDTDAASNIKAIGQNALMNAQLVRTGSRAQIAQMRSQERNSLLDAFSGGISGYQAGLQIGQTI